MFMIIAAALLGAAEPEPLDPDLVCIVDRISASTRASLLNAAATGEGGAVRQAFRDATETCARERVWSVEFASAAGRIATAFVLGEEAAALLQRNGISPDLIHDWFEARPVSTRQNAQIGQETSELLLTSLQADGIPLERLEANAQTIGVMLGALHVIERIGAGLE